MCGRKSVAWSAVDEGCVTPPSSGAEAEWGGHGWRPTPRSAQTACAERLRPELPGKPSPLPWASVDGPQSWSSFREQCSSHPDPDDDDILEDEDDDALDDDLDVDDDPDEKIDHMEEAYQGPEKPKGDRRTDRRAGGRRAQTDRRNGLERRRGPGRRRGEVRRRAEEGEISGELMEFIMAIDEYKRINERPFPNHSEIFEIVKYLGYRKVADVAEHINVVESEESD